MTTIMIRFFAVLTAILAFSFISFAQKAERIDFAKEGPSLVWEQKVSANSTKDFVFYAKKGQKLSISFIDDTNIGSMDLGKYSIEPNTEPFEMTIEVTKDYYLSVSNNSNKATSFRIAISLEFTDNSSNTSSTHLYDNSYSERVQFKKGESSAMLTREILPNGSIDFIINARKGQTMSFTVGYDFKDSDVEVFLNEPDLQDISLFAAPKAPYEFVVKKSGDHRLIVSNTTNKKITITLYLDIF